MATELVTQGSSDLVDGSRIDSLCSTARTAIIGVTLKRCSGTGMGITRNQKRVDIAPVGQNRNHRLFAWG